MSKLSYKAFQKKVWGHFKHHGRSLPWRETRNPYHILVSEIMLQQTQVDRVIPKYRAWLRRFPTSSKVALAPRSEILTMWQGLGYNRRALALHRAVTILSKNKKFPSDYDSLLALPGIGPYTAQAILTFAFNQPTILIETNIRTVFIHHFFNTKQKVNDRDLVPFIEKTLDHTRPREWYWALMDYGAHLKKTVGNVSQRSTHYARQNRFIGSDRHIRGQILKYISIAPTTRRTLQQHLVERNITPATSHLEKILAALTTEGFIVYHNKRFSLAQ